MTRKEQIRKASIEYTMSVRPNAIGGSKFEDLIEAYNTNPSFIAGAEWADSTMKDKVCEYLAQNLVCTGYTLQSIAKFIRELKKEVFNYKEQEQ